jgi:hypothetical protein
MESIHLIDWNSRSATFNKQNLTQDAGAFSPSQICLSGFIHDGLSRRSCRRLLVIRAIAIANCTIGSHTRNLERTVCLLNPKSGQRDARDSVARNIQARIGRICAGGKNPRHSDESNRER